MYIPRRRKDIRNQIGAVVVAQSGLTDIAPGSDWYAVIDGMAMGIAMAEYGFAELAATFGFTTADGYPLTGRALDERCAELPGFTARLAAAPAAGACMTLTRSAIGTPLPIPAGTIFGRSDSNITYVSTTDQAFGAGDYTYPVGAGSPLHVVATRPGVDTDAPVGAINRLITPLTDVTAVTNSVAISGGEDRESDDAVFARAFLYIQALGRVQAGAARYLALSHESDLGGRIRFAYVAEDVQRPAYAELVIDDGSGMAGYEQSGAEYIGTVPVNGQRVLYHDRPATGAIHTIQIDKGGGYSDYLTGDPPRWTSLPERGIVVIHDPDLLDPGDDWKITDYNVWTGPISEIQALVEGDINSPNTVPGYRTRGARLRVRPPRVTEVDVTVVAVWDGNNTDISASRAELETTIAAYMRTLAPGEPMFLHNLHAYCDDIFGDLLVNMTITTPSTDYYPADNVTVLRAGTITVT